MNLEFSRKEQKNQFVFFFEKYSVMVIGVTYHGHKTSTKFTPMREVWLGLYDIKPCPFNNSISYK